MENTAVQITSIKYSNLKSILNSAIHLFYAQNCTIKTLTDCLVARNQHSLSLPN